MSDVFWNDLDALLVSTFDAQMGASSAYGTMKLATVNSRIFADAHEYSTWTLPALATACYDIGYNATEHTGSTGRLYTRTYRCMAWVVVEGNVNIATGTDTVTAKVKELYERAEKALREQPFSLTSGGARSRRPIIERGVLDIARFPNDSIDSTRRMGLAVFMFNIEAKV